MPVNTKKDLIKAKNILANSDAVLVITGTGMSVDPMHATVLPSCPHCDSMSHPNVWRLRVF
jgi:hypothetical protein